MEKKFTFDIKTVACSLTAILFLFFNLIASKSYAQVSCPNQKVIFLQTFGTGTTPSSDPDVVTSGLTYQATGSLIGEGRYRVINNTQQKPEWQNSPDHTGDVNGKMMVINGQAETYYSHQIDSTHGFDPGTFTASLWIMNVDTMGLCGVNALLTNITFRVEYLSAANTWEPLTGSPYLAAPVPQTSPSAPTWIQLGSTFLLPQTGSFRVTSIRIVLSDGTIGGCGNDFAMDDVQFAACPEGGSLPVTFLGISARQTGSGVSVDWSSSQEINSNHFDVLKSADGNTNWESVASINAAGNSASVKKYSAFDPKPFGGINFYRVRQVDNDGNFTYTKTVSVNLNFAKIGISVLTNPFHNSLTVDFTSATTQPVFARLIDITGKQVAMEKWNVATGSSTQYFSNINGLQQGMYILNIISGSGEILFNNKVIKQ
ncbi:MAG TPA: T9SS type A sorting domain-containing protein [Ginsengibacter sp.]